MLFLGCSLEDWDFRTLHKGLIDRLQKHEKRVSFATQKEPTAFWVNYWQQAGVKIIDMDVSDFAEPMVPSQDCQLRSHCSGEGVDQPDQEHEIPGGERRRRGAADDDPAAEAE